MGLADRGDETLREVRAILDQQDPTVDPAVGQRAIIEARV